MLCGSGVFFHTKHLLEMIFQPVESRSACVSEYKHALCFRPCERASRLSTRQDPSLTSCCLNPTRQWGAERCQKPPAARPAGSRWPLPPPCPPAPPAGSNMPVRTAHRSRLFYMPLTLVTPLCNPNQWMPEPWLLTGWPWPCARLK